MVTISEILQTVVAGLPDVTIGSKDYPVNFFEGVLSDVKEQINNYKKNNEMPYPCIWLIRDFPELKELNRISISGLQLIALIDTEGSYRAPERLQNRIDPYLMPLKDNLIRGLQLAGVFVLNENTTKLTFLGNPNAGVTAANSQTNARIFSDYLDGLKINIDVSYQLNLKIVCYEFR